LPLSSQPICRTSAKRPVTAAAAAKEGHDRYLRALKLWERKAINEEDFGAARLTKIKFEAEHITKQGAVKLANNEKDLADIPKNVLDTLDIHLVSVMDEVLKIALAEPLPARMAAPVVSDVVAADDTRTH